MSTLTWLHLSDLHFRTSQTYDANVVLRELLKDVAERIAEDGLRPDLILVSGDVAFAGQAAEYALARRFFDDLLQTTGLGKEHLFLVPGNHDVDRRLITLPAQATADQLKDRESTNQVLGHAQNRRLMFDRFKGYAKFTREYLGGHLPFSNERYFYVRTLALAGLQVAVLGLNTAWLCASDEDKAKGLLIGERQARAALEAADGAGLKIALLHHPFDWLREFDQNDSAAMLVDGCDFILHGHLHQTAATHYASPDGKVAVLACGACYESRGFPNMHNWVLLDLAAGTATVYLRRYSDARGGFWARDTMSYRSVPNGEYAFPLPGRVAPAKLSPGAVRPAAVTTEPAPASRPALGARPPIDPGNPPYGNLRSLLQAAFEPKTLYRLSDDDPFKPLRYRFSPSDNLDDMIDEVFEFCRTQAYWEELLDAVAAKAPRAYNRFAGQWGWPPAPEAAAEPRPASSPQDKPPSAPAPDRAGLERALTMAHRTLAILEEQAAGFGALHVPAHLQIELEEKRREVADLEARLKEKAGK